MGNKGDMTHGRGRTRPRSAPTGFTLLEIMVMMIILSILAAVAMARLMDPGEVDLTVHVDAAKVHYRYAQALSMGTLNPWGIRRGTGVYNLFKADDPGTARMLPGEDSTTVTLPAGMTISLSSGGNDISFSAWGVPCSDSAGTVPLATDAIVTMTYQGRSETFTITQETGYIP
jgi:prepilin-type N-terminal cleavage/methylation domain-containing protein